MLQASDKDGSAPAFTLVELILVMALMVTILALSAPSLSRSLKARAVNQEATRLLAMIEYARDEAISQGVPMVLWIDAENGHFGAQAKEGYAGNDSRQKEFFLNPAIHFDALDEAAQQGGLTIAVEFDPDGTPDPSSVYSLRLTDQKEESATLTQTDDGWGYEIAKSEQ